MNNKREKKTKKIFAIIAIIAIMTLVGYQVIFSVLNFNQQMINQEKRTEVESFGDSSQSKEIELETNQNQIKPSLPELKPAIEEKKTSEKIHLPVPFTSQSPYADWTELHNEACEETSLMMVDAFLKNKKFSKESANREIIAMVDWQIKNWGEHKDLTLKETKELAEKYFGYENVRVETDITLDDIKKELNNGNPVIVPLAGRMLGNPYYRRPGPYYHMLVVIGYEKDKFITNDPGTRRGEDYMYDQNLLFNAIHDWPGRNQDILTGTKAILIVK